MSTTIHIAFKAPETRHPECPCCRCKDGGWKAYLFSTKPMSRAAWKALPAIRPIDEWLRRTKDGGWMVGFGPSQAAAVADLRSKWKNRAPLDHWRRHER